MSDGLTHEEAAELIADYDELAAIAQHRLNGILNLEADLRAAVKRLELAEAALTEVLGCCDHDWLESVIAWQATR